MLRSLSIFFIIGGVLLIATGVYKISRADFTTIPIPDYLIGAQDMKDKILTADRIAEYNRQHRALYDALRSRQIDGAVRIITEHLEKARSDLLGADRG